MREWFLSNVCDFCNAFYFFVLSHPRTHSSADFLFLVLPNDNNGAASCIIRFAFTRGQPTIAGRQLRPWGVRRKQVIRPPQRPSSKKLHTTGSRWRRNLNGSSRAAAA